MTRTGHVGLIAVRYGVWTVAVFASLYFCGLYSYLLFHTIAELFSIAVAIGMFMVAWHSWKYSKNGFLLFLGTAYLFVGSIDLLHTLAYKGMNVFRGDQTNLATQFWVSARFIQAVSLLVAPMFIQRSFKPNRMLHIYSAIVVLVISAILRWKVFPVCIVEGEGLTPFKIALEYVIAVVLVSALVVLWKQRTLLDTVTFRLLAAAIVITILSELIFTLYSDVYGFSNQAGHLLKIAAFFMIYRAVVAGVLEKPYGLLFRDIEAKNATLRASEKGFRSLFELSGVGKAEADPATGQFVRVNRRLCEITGYSETELLKMTYADLTHPQDREEDQRKVEPVLKAEITAWHTEKRYIRNDGTIIWVSVYGSVIVDDEGKPLRSIADIVDITDRKEAEEKMASVAKFPQENPFPVMRISKRGSVIYANEAASSLLRQWGCTAGDVLDEKRCGELSDAVRGRARTDIELRYGDEWYLLEVVPIAGQDYVNVYGRDITEAKRAAQELHISEQRYALAQRAANIGTWDWHIPTGDLTWSDTIEHMFGFGQGEFGKSYEAFLDCLHQEDKQKVVDAVNKAVETGAEYEVEHRVIRPDGTVRWMSETGTVFRDSNGIAERIIGIVADITGHREKRQELETKVEKQAGVLADTVESLARVSGQKDEMQEELTQRQQALEAIYAIASTFGTSLDTVYDQIVTSLADILDVPFVAVVVMEKNRRRIASLFERGGLRHDSRYCPEGSSCDQVLQSCRVVRASGLSVHNYSNQSCFAKYDLSSYLGIPILAHDMPVLGAICIMGEAGRSFSEEEIHLAEIFARYVSRELVRVEMEKQLRQAEELKRLGQLTSGVAHEVRNPLNAILAIIEALFQDIGDKPEYQEYLRHIRAQGNRLSVLMQDLLDLGRPMRTSEMRVLPLGDLARNAVELWRSSTPHSSHDIHCIVPQDADQWRVKVDGTKMQQVLLNLIENACDHSPDDSPIEVRVFPAEGGRAGIAVVDRGNGVLSEHIDRVFDPFFTTRKHGTGLGLNIVRHIVNLHGGEVTLRDNEPPPGATALVRLPLYEQPAMEALPPAQ